MSVKISKATKDDIPFLEKIVQGMGGRREAGYFEKCFAQSRDILVAVTDDRPAASGSQSVGYIQINWNPAYAGFRRFSIPEIQDLNVLPDFRRQGIGSALVGYCEEAVKAKGKKEIGISVGLDSGYGSAQRLYVKMGYVPDGAGIAYDDAPVRFGDMKPVDDLLTLKMLKRFD